MLFLGEVPLNGEDRDNVDEDLLMEVKRETTLKTISFEIKYITIHSYLSFLTAPDRVWEQLNRRH